MSAKDADEKFLSRWSRRKIEARVADVAPDGEPGAEPGPASPSGTSPPAIPPSGAGESTVPGSPGPLPSVEDLRGLESDYRAFLRPEVDESLRRSALKKLFQDPHFNVMDGLDTYIDDYTKADPIPEAMLRALNQAQGLLFDRDEGHDTHAEQPAGTDAVPEQPKTPETASRAPSASDDGDAAQPNPDPAPA